MSFGLFDRVGNEMGNTSSNRPDLIADGEPDFTFADEHSINRGTCVLRQPILKFHSVHGDNLTIQKAGRCARRKESFCKSLCFSNRPILIDEIVCIKLSEVSNLWSGVLRFGVTTMDPAGFRDIELPKFACPDLTSKVGYWAKALPERYCVQDTIVHFMVNSDGTLHYGINGLNKGVFLTRINVNQNLWGIFDIYGNTKQIEFVDPMSALPSEVQMISRNVLVPPDPINNTTNTSTDAPLRFSRTCGPTVEVDARGLLASRVGHEFSQAYIFSNRPVKMDEEITVIIMKNTPEFMGSMAFGLTSCDPATIGDMSSLPADSDNLLERSEYWVCIKNVAVNPRAGDITTFRVRQSGEVMFRKNEHSERAIMYVDTSIPLWAFFDLYGSTSKIRLAGGGESSNSQLPTRSINSSFEAALQRTDELNRRLRELTAVRVELPPPQINLQEDRDNQDRESTEHNASNESTERVQSGRHLFGSSSNRSPSETSRPSPAVLDLISSLAASAAERVALPPVHSTPIITRASTRSPVPPDSSLPNFDFLSLSDRDSQYRPSSLRTPTTHRTALSSINLDTWERPTSVPRSSSANPRTAEEIRLSCSPSNLSNLARFELPSTSSAVSSSNSSTTAISAPVPLTTSRTSTEDKSSTENRANLTAISTQRPSESANTSQQPQQSGGADTECVICMDNKVDCVLYRCGHMCLCMKCARETQDTNSQCPICRTIIMDIIKIYQI